MLRIVLSSSQNLRVSAGAGITLAAAWVACWIKTFSPKDETRSGRSWIRLYSFSKVKNTNSLREISAARQVLPGISGESRVLEEFTRRSGILEDEPKCPVTEKKKHATEREALATAELATANAPKELRAYGAPSVMRGT
jgi:hypothetical protein